MGSAGDLTDAASGYWSSTEASINLARLLFFNASSVFPQASGGKSLGFAVRCVR